MKKHAWFKKIDWKLLMEKKIKPPFKPLVTSPDDTRNIDQMFLRETIKETMPLMNMSSFTTRQQNHFEYFTYISNRQSNVGAPPTINDGKPIMHSGHRMVSKTTAVDEEDNEEDGDGGDHGEMYVEIV